MIALIIFPDLSLNQLCEVLIKTTQSRPVFKAVVANILMPKNTSGGSSLISQWVRRYRATALTAATTQLLGQGQRLLDWWPALQSDAHLVGQAGC